MPFLLYVEEICRFFSLSFLLCRFLGLAQHGAAVNARDHSEQTALHWAAVCGSVPVADLLLQNGARIECADSHGYRVRYSG